MNEIRGDGETLLFTCAGAAHCGQVANRAALELTGQGVGQVFCLAAISAWIDEKLERSRRASCRIAIDGCEDHCARKTLELAGLPHLHLDLASIGIEKKPERPDLVGDSRKAANRVRELLEAVA